MWKVYVGVGAVALLLSSALSGWLGWKWGGSKCDQDTAKLLTMALEEQAAHHRKQIDAITAKEREEVRINDQIDDLPLPVLPECRSPDGLHTIESAIDIANGAGSP